MRWCLHIFEHKHVSKLRRDAGMLIFGLCALMYPDPQAITTPSRGPTAMTHILSRVIRHLSCYLGLMCILKMFEYLLC